MGVSLLGVSTTLFYGVILASLVSYSSIVINVKITKHSIYIISGGYHIVLPPLGWRRLQFGESMSCVNRNPGSYRYSYSSTSTFHRMLPWRNLLKEAIEAIRA